MNITINKKRVLHISKGGVGGVDTIVSQIANHRKDKSILFFSDDPTNLYHKKVFIKTFLIGSEILFFKFREIIKFSSLIKEVSIIHIHLTNLIILFLFPFFYQKKIIFSIHKNFGENYTLLYKENLFKHMGFLIIRKISMLIYLNYINTVADKILVLTKYQKQIFLKNVIFKKMFSSKTFVIGNFILENNIVDKKEINLIKTVIFIGRLSKYKGFHDLLRVTKDLQEENLCFLFIGEGILKNKILTSSKISYIPRVNNSEIYSYLDMADILVLPSYSESFGLVIIEAMARGLGIISSNLPSVEEFFKDGINGYTFPVGDVIALESKILNFLKNPEDLIRISKNNIIDSHKYTETLILEKYEEVYNSLL